MTCPGLPGLLYGFIVALGGLIVAAGWPTPSPADEPAPKRYSSIERMAPARLKAAHEDVARIQKSRRVSAPLPGLRDYRAILHAHAEDSAHTGGTRPRCWPTPGKWA